MNGLGPGMPPPPGGVARPWPMPAGLRPGMPPPMPPPMPPQQQLNVHMTNLRRRPESEYMGADEIDSILRIQWKSLHNGPPYLEDYYYQVRWRPIHQPALRKHKPAEPAVNLIALS